jgi:uncharacterized protein YkvS
MPFECIINVVQFDNGTKYTVEINGEKLNNNKIITDLPIWMINNYEVFYKYIYLLYKKINNLD